MRAQPKDVKADVLGAEYAPGFVPKTLLYLSSHGLPPLTIQSAAAAVCALTPARRELYGNPTLSAQTALSLQKAQKRTLYRQNKACGSIPFDLSKKPIQLIADSAFLGLSKTACLAGGSKEAFAMSNHRQLRLTCVMGADAGGD